MYEERIPNGTIVIEKETGKEHKIIDAIEIDKKCGYGIYLYCFEDTKTGYGLLKVNLPYREVIKCPIKNCTIASIAKVVYAKNIAKNKTR